jgi:hypothetical protein
MIRHCKLCIVHQLIHLFEISKCFAGCYQTLLYDKNLEPSKRFSHEFGRTNLSDALNHKPLLNSFSFAVKKDITVQNTKILANEKISLRAVDYILLEEGFEVDLGGVFYGNVHELKEN